jgi:hypothetical protein
MNNNTDTNLVLLNLLVKRFTNSNDIELIYDYQFDYTSDAECVAVLGSHNMVPRLFSELFYGATEEEKNNGMQLLSCAKWKWNENTVSTYWPHIRRKIENTDSDRPVDLLQFGIVFKDVFYKKSIEAFLRLFAESSSFRRIATKEEWREMLLKTFNNHFASLLAIENPFLSEEFLNALKKNHVQIQLEDVFINEECFAPIEERKNNFYFFDTENL